VSHAGHLRVLLGQRKGLEVATTGSGDLRLVLVSDSALIGDGLEALFERAAGVTVVGRVAEPDQLSIMVDELEPDAAVISLRTIAASATPVIRAARELRENHPDLGVVIISDRGNGFALELLRGGSTGTAYLLDEQLLGIESVISAVRGVLGGQTVLDPSVVDALVLRQDAVSIDHLTLREVEVLEQIALGLSNRSAAKELRITIKAVENHVTAIFRKLALTERSDIHHRVTAALTYLDRTH
jgi:DNA-binding NarL/FixJ family response regulator